MQAAVAESPAGPIRVRAIARPHVEPGSVLVRIHESGVNPLDTKIHAGAAPHARQPLPAILDSIWPAWCRASAPEWSGFAPGMRCSA
jgi:NADPH:quinone reductase-like Zn-dependent oxidoreductase